MKVILLMVTLSNEATARGREKPLTPLGFVGWARQVFGPSGKERSSNGFQPEMSQKVNAKKYHTFKGQRTEFG